MEKRRPGVCLSLARGFATERPGRGTLHGAAFSLETSMEGLPSAVKASNRATSSLLTDLTGQGDGCGPRRRPRLREHGL